MSKTCGFKDAEMYYDRESGEITEEEFNQYWDNNCGKCFICVKFVCMERNNEKVQIFKG
jgi:hypothetical protein